MDGMSADSNLSRAGIHCELVRDTLKLDGVRCGVHTPRRLQQTTASCKRSDCNKLKKSSKSTHLRFCEKTAHNGSHRSVMSLRT